MLHLAGSGCPLYGTDMGVKKSDRPHFKMNYLYSVVAINIVNETDGPIAIDYVEFKANEAIVGEFKVNITNGTPSYTADGTTSEKTKVKLDKPVEIKANGSYKLYLAIKPFEASNDQIVISINGTATKDNGVSKVVTMPADARFLAGKITTLTVPVVKPNEKDFGPTNTNVLDETDKASVVTEYDLISWNPGWRTAKQKIAVFQNSTTADFIINGKTVTAHIIGSEAGTGNVTVRGTAKELFKYLPMGFYAASWNNTKGVMRLASISAWFDLVGTGPITFTYSSLTTGDNPIIADVSKITFTGLLELEHIIHSSIDQSGKSITNTHMIILDEEPFHKAVRAEQVEKLLSNFDDNKADDANGYKPTFSGLKAAITNPGSVTTETSDITKLTDPRDITAFIIWKKLKTKLSGNILLKAVATLLFRNPQKMFDMAANMPISVTLETVGDSDGATDNRIVVWGLNSEYDETK